jgi:ABC-type transporter Mla MlaB component
LAPLLLLKGQNGGDASLMTCRIDRLSTEQGLVLYISGRIAAKDVEVVRTALDESRVVAIDVAAVELVDSDAVKLLAQIEAEGIELKNCPAYVREWITKERENNS